MHAEFTGLAKDTEGRSETDTKEKQQRISKLTWRTSFTLVFFQLGMLEWEEVRIRLKRMRWKFFPLDTHAL